MFNRLHMPACASVFLCMLAFLWLPSPAAGRLLAPDTSAHALLLSADRDATAPVGRHAMLLEEPAGQALDLAAAQRAWTQGEFRASTSAVPNRGNFARPVWLRMVLDNRDADAPYRLYLAQSWTGTIDAWLMMPDGRVLPWQSGQRRSPSAFLRPGIGYAFDARLPVGESVLFARVDSVASSVMDMRVVPLAAAADMEGDARRWNGLVHGFLLALILTYFLLWLPLREPAHLRYVLYALAFLFMHMTYSGLSASMFWPDNPRINRFATLGAMTLFASAGLWFARAFLEVDRWKPRLDTTLKWGVRVVLTVMAVLILLDAEHAAVALVFPYVAIFSLLVVILGAMAWQRRQPQAGTFLCAALARTTGLMVTVLSVTGFLPYSTLSFRAVEMGVLVEATIWAMSLGMRLRKDRTNHKLSLHLSQRDPLTGLLNRRGFLDLARPKLAQCRSANQPVALVLVDIDHFKAVNDVHGHEAGDMVLVEAAARFASVVRSADLIARWGGEEFLILMCEMQRDQALEFAERLRMVLSQQPIALPDAVRAHLTSSVGLVVSHRPEELLEQLLHKADAALYAAKEGGRDRVVDVADLGKPSSPCS